MSRTIGVAIGLPEPYSAELQEWRERIGDGLAFKIPPHVTLLPPTNLRSSDDMDVVEEHLGHVARAGTPFGMRLTGTDTFRPVSQVEFVPVVVGSEACTRTQVAVRSGPLARDLAFPYHPHVTVGHDLPDAALDEAAQGLAAFDAAFWVWGFTMFERGKDGIWRPQRDFAFRTDAPGPTGV